MRAQLFIQEPFSRLLLDLYRAARKLPTDQFQEAALLLLKPMLQFDSSMWGSGSLSDGGLAVHSMHLHEQPREYIEDWQHVNHEDTAAYECAERMGWVMNAHTPTLYRDRRKAGLRDLTSRFGIGNALVTAYAQRAMPLIHWASLYRKDPDRQYSERERALFEALMPHVVEALTINRLVNLDTMYTRHKAQRACLAVVDRRGVIYHSDGDFEDLVRTEWPAWDADVLPRPLVDMLNTVDTRTFRGLRIVVEVRTLADLCFLRARALTAVDALSLREKQVAQHFGAGRSHKEIAQLLGISPATVRNHLQAIYGKLGVSDKAELARLMVIST